MSQKLERDIKFMADLDAQFRAASGLSDRRFYSIFYSRLHPSPLMVLGIKPGGATDGSHQLASSSLYEDWSHEYVDMNYTIASIMRPALLKALETNDLQVLRRVPKSNTFFHRAVGTDDFTGAELRANVSLCAPFVREMIAYVRPRAIVLEGMAARDNLVEQLRCVPQLDAAETIVGLRRGRVSRFFQKENVYIDFLNSSICLLSLGHPSHFGHLETWPLAIEALRRNLGSGFRPTETNDAPIGVGVPSLAIRKGNDLSHIENRPHRMDMPRHSDDHVVSRTSGRQRPATPDTLYEATAQPPADFGYQPMLDFWRELVLLGPTSPRELHKHMNALGWIRPSGKKLTLEVMRTDIVSMVKNGFARRLTD